MRRTLPLFAALLLPAFAAAQPASTAPPTIQITSRIVYIDVITTGRLGTLDMPIAIHAQTAGN